MIFGPTSFLQSVSVCVDLCPVFVFARGILCAGFGVVRVLLFSGANCRPDIEQENTD